MALRMICQSLATRASVPLRRIAATGASQRVASVVGGLLHHAEFTEATSRGQRLMAARSFYPAAVTQSGLDQVLQEEINHEKDTYQPAEAVAAGPPEPWQVKESPGGSLLELTRSFGDEQIKIDTMVTNQPDEPAEMFEEEGQPVEMDVDVGIVFNVSVVKPNGQALVFECKSDGSYMEIIHAVFETKHENVQDTDYTGPVYEELDEAVHAAFDAYLAERGVNNELGAYLMELVHDKEQREYMGWLDNVKKFIAA